VVNREIIQRRLSKLEQSLRKLKDLSCVSLEDYLKSEAIQDRVERNLQIAAQACIDIGSHVVADREYRTPSGYGDIFNILQEEGLLPGELAGAMKQVAGFRNILVHDYLDVDLVVVYQSLGKIDDFRRFAQFVIEWL